MREYIPKKGDFISVTFDPRSGHEQKGRRPALVVSNALFNESTSLAIVCPLTTTHRGYPFHVAVIGHPDVKGFVMVEQVKSVDCRVRHAKSLGKASNDLLDEVLSILDACIY
jgi:mRNA interferase MazF